MKPDPASLWHDAMKRAGHFHPDRIAAQIVASADSGLKAQRYDTMGGRTTFEACRDANCFDGNPEYNPHSHQVVSDPTGNAATNGQPRDTTTRDLHHVNVARKAFVSSAAEVLYFVCGDRPTTWDGIRHRNATLVPGSIESGVEVDHERVLPYHITRVDKAVAALVGASRRYAPRAPSKDEEHWTAGLADEVCCSWHLEVAPKGHYRRPRVGGTNCCGECLQVGVWLGRKPPDWFMEALVERESKPKAYDRALSRLADEDNVPAHMRSA